MKEREGNQRSSAELYHTTLWGEQIPQPTPLPRQTKKKQEPTHSFTGTLWPEMKEPSTPALPGEQAAETSGVAPLTDPDQRIPSLPFDPEVTLPVDLQPFVTYIPRHLMRKEALRQGIQPCITTRFFIYSRDRDTYRSYVPGILLRSEDGEQTELLSYGQLGQPFAIEEAYAEIRKAMQQQGIHPGLDGAHQQPGQKTAEEQATDKQHGKPVAAVPLLPEDLQGIVSLVPVEDTYAEKRSGIEIPTTLYIFVTQENGHTSYIPGIVTNRNEETDQAEIMTHYHAQLGDIHNVYGYLREAARELGLLAQTSNQEEEKGQSPLPPPVPQEAGAQHQKSVTVYERKTAQNPSRANDEQSPDPLEDSNAFIAQYVTVHPLHLPLQKPESIQSYNVLTPYYILTLLSDTDTRYVPGMVKDVQARDKRQGKQDLSLLESRSLNTAVRILQEVERQTRAGSFQIRKLTTMLAGEEQPHAQLTATEEIDLRRMLYLRADFLKTQAKLTEQAQADRSAVKLSDEHEPPLPFDVHKLIKVQRVYNMSREQRKSYVIPTLVTIVGVAGVRLEDPPWYKAGIVVARDPETMRQTKIVWFVEDPTALEQKDFLSTDTELAYHIVIREIRARGLTEADLQPLKHIPAPQPKREPKEPTPEELAEQPLRAILRPEEIYVDPHEVPIEDAEEHNFPLLRRDVTSHIWWLEFGYDTREDPALNEALKEHGWKWGGYHQQMYNRNPYARVPTGLYYANAGPCEYAADRPGRYEARAERATEQSNAHFANFNRMASIIPFGQPMMPDHYSYNRDRRFRERIANQIRKAGDYYQKAAWLESRSEGSAREQAYRKTRFAMAERAKRLEADVRSVRRDYESIKRLAVGEKNPYGQEIITEEKKEHGLNRERRMLTILAREIIPLHSAIQEQGGLAIDTAAQKPETGALLLMGKSIVLAGKITKANKTNLRCIDYSVPGFTKEGWSGSYPLTSFQRVLMNAEEVRLALAEGKTYADLTNEWKQRLTKQSEDE